MGRRGGRDQVGRTAPGAVLNQNHMCGIAWAVLVLGVAIEAKIMLPGDMREWQREEMAMMETPMENTVTDFELAEEGLSVVLTNAIEDQRAVVDHLTEKHDQIHRQWFGNEKNEKKKLEPRLTQAAEMQFRAMRVLGLLEATREREAGQVT